MGINQYATEAYVLMLGVLPLPDATPEVSDDASGLS